MVESGPAIRANSGALIAAAQLNCFSTDALVRPHVQVMVTQKLLEATDAPEPHTEAEVLFLAHCSLRLHSEAAEYAELWSEQLGPEWREERRKHTWPVLEDDDRRWLVRAAIDAVVAVAYRLDRDQYAHVLASFNHKSYPRAPELCLHAFDDLAKHGLAAFCKKHDPYWDIPLVTTLPNPVLDLPGGAETAATLDNGPLFGGPESAAATRPRQRRERR
jgi:hypothetical protein